MAMKISVTLNKILKRHFGDKCRSCKFLRSSPNRGKNVKIYCGGKAVGDGENPSTQQFPFAKKCSLWEVEWTTGKQNETIGDYLARKHNLILK